ncbi:MAG: LysM peptidoglycan-binding domain-containing protein [Gammaproteobacteria bacterium]
MIKTSGLFQFIRIKIPLLGLLFLQSNLSANTQNLTDQDFWAAVRNEFLLDIPDNARIQVHRKWYFNNPDYLERVLTRAKPYLWHIRLEILRRGMPGEILFLPLVESAYSPYARSAWKAVGLWQFIPTTGKRFKLSQNGWYDGRRDILQSTEAALNYLELLYKRFDNDWLLALAAYNSGEGTVSKAIRRNKKAHKPIDFWHLKLPRETREYVPNLLAVCNLIQDPEKHNIQLPPTKDAPFFEIVNIEDTIDLATAADLAKMPLQDLENLNPGFLMGLIPPDGPKRLLVPIENSAELIVALENTKDIQKSRWKKHHVRSGDTLSEIAKKYGTSIKIIRYANNLSGNTIKIKQILRIPTNTTSKRFKDTIRVKRYLVRKGDTLWDIARSHNVSVKMLRRWNELSPRGIIRPGEQLKLAAN